MSLTPETGAGVQGADSYATIAFIDAYWAARTHDPNAAAWAAANTPRKEGAAREATTFTDATWGPYYRGVRRGYVQGLLQPRTGAKDDANYPLPDLPDVLPIAVAELAARALAGRLAVDVDMTARIKSTSRKIGPIERRTEYFDAAVSAPRSTFGVVESLLAPILNGSQPRAPNINWSWA